MRARIALSSAFRSASVSRSTCAWYRSHSAHARSVPLGVAMPFRSCARHAAVIDGNGDSALPMSRNERASRVGSCPSRTSSSFISLAHSARTICG